MKIDYFYHATSELNAIGILRSRALKPNAGTPNAGFRNNFVSLSDYLNDYLEVIFGNVIFEFYADNIFQKNNIYPRIYDTDIDFDDMPFEECEWIAKEINFSYSHASRIIYIKTSFARENNYISRLVR